MAEDLTDYLNRLNIKAHYLHSEIDSIDRTELIRDLRLAKFDVLVGINLLREGLDLPEVSLVAILDADKEGFLRSAQSLIQTSGRAARHSAGRVIFYADNMTESIKKAMSETARRRQKQLAYNEEHGITPESIIKTKEEIMRATQFADSRTLPDTVIDKPSSFDMMSGEDQIAFLSKAMRKSAENLEFESAAQLRDEITRIRDKMKRSKSRK